MATYFQYLGRTVNTAKTIFQSQNRSFGRLIGATKMIFQSQNRSFGRLIGATKMIFQSQNRSFGRLVYVSNRLPSSLSASLGRLISVSKNLSWRFPLILVEIFRDITATKEFNWRKELVVFLGRIVRSVSTTNFNKILTQVFSRLLSVSASRKLRVFLGRYGYVVLNARMPYSVEVYGGRLVRLVKLGNIFVLRIEPEGDLDIIFLDEYESTVAIYKSPPRELLIFRFRF